VPFAEYASAWIEERPNLRPKTIRLYRYLLRAHLQPAFGCAQWLPKWAPQNLVSRANVRIAEPASNVLKMAAAGARRGPVAVGGS
jgi:hypothetical protein